MERINGSIRHKFSDFEENISKELTILSFFIIVYILYLLKKILLIIKLLIYIN